MLWGPLCSGVLCSKQNSRHGGPEIHTRCIVAKWCTPLYGLFFFWIHHHLFSALLIRNNNDAPSWMIMDTPLTMCYTIYPCLSMEIFSVWCLAYPSKKSHPLLLNEPLRLSVLSSPRLRNMGGQDPRSRFFVRNMGGQDPRNVLVTMVAKRKVQ